MKRLSMILISLILGISACQPSRKPVAIIPQPQTMTEMPGEFILDSRTQIHTDPGNEELTAIADYFKEIIRNSGGAGLDMVQSAYGPASAAVVFELVSEPDTLGEEGYMLDVTSETVHLRANRPAGLFRGIQTIRQLLPPDIESAGNDAHTVWTIPCVSIIDKPRFPWRGMLLDCGRHFMTRDFVKRYIDLLAYHKMNTLHWHLTEDQGWRIEIRKYPKLTSVGAWRTYDNGETYGGFYTQEDIREVVAYAKSRYITVVPEIEMPGHSVAALAAYPQFSCTGGPFRVQTQWGVHKDVYCAGNEQTFKFLEDVLTEVMELFPSEYIHIGGDECPKDRWSECSKCQRRIRREKLADEHELQSYFIKRMEQFLNRHGRQIIGWDEILEGGLAPGATVQSWRGIEGGIAAAQSGHDAIMSPTSHAYFDYEVDVTDLRKVYSFEPVPEALTKDEARHILGGECNMWTERAPQEAVDQKMFPRMLAMCEVLWSSPAGRDYDEFYERVQVHYNRLERLGVDYGPESKPLSVYASFDTLEGVCKVTLETGEKNLEMRYTLDNTTPDIHSSKVMGAIVLKNSAVLKGRAFKNGQPYGMVDSVRYIHHAAVGHAPQVSYPFSYNYQAGGAIGLADGIMGSEKFNDGYWQGYEGTDMETVTDLGALKPLDRVNVRFLKNTGVWIFLPLRVRLFTSGDGTDFNLVREFVYPESQNDPDIEIREFQFDLPGDSIRYLKLQAESVKTCPDWHPGKGGKAWVFIDEIVVR